MNSIAIVIVFCAREINKVQKKEEDLCGDNDDYVQVMAFEQVYVLVRATQCQRYSGLICFAYSSAMQLGRMLCRRAHP